MAFPNNINAETDVEYIGTITDSDGVAIDITGGTVTFTARQQSGVIIDITKVATLSTPLDGEYTLTLTNVETDITPAVYEFEIRFVNAATQEYVSQRSTFKIIEKIKA